MERLLGVAAAVGASIAWALNPAFFRVGARGVDAATFNALRVLSALPFLAALVVGVERLELPSAPEAWLYIAAASIIGVGLGDALYIEASKRIGGGRAVTIGYLYIFASQLPRTCPARRGAWDANGVGYAGSANRALASCYGGG